MKFCKKQIKLIMNLFIQENSSQQSYIQEELVAMLHENAISYLNVRRFCREDILDLNLEEASSLPNDDDLNGVNEAILLALSDEPFSSVRQMRSKMHCILSTCPFSAFHSPT
jgi:hypothetical protein